MKDLHSYFRSPFGTQFYGIGKLHAFSVHHLDRLRDNNPGGIYDGRIAATQSALDALNVALSGDDQKYGERLTSKGRKRDFRKSLTPALSKIYIALQVKYGVKSPKLYEFFPGGRTRFIKCRDATLGDELNVLVDALTAHEAELGPELPAAAQDLQTRWEAVHADSTSTAGAKNTTMLDKKAARAALEMELFRNVLALAQKFAGQPDKLNTFMQQSLLTRHRPKKTAKGNGE